MKLLEDLTLLDDYELQYRLNVYKEFSLMLKEEMQDIILIYYGFEKHDYDFDKEYQDAFEEFPDSSFKYSDPWTYNSIAGNSTIRYKKLSINYTCIKDSIQEIERELNTRNKHE